MDNSRELDWPWWSTWAAALVAFLCAATVAATLYDIW
jgi:hypothetical protein